MTELSDDGTQLQTALWVAQIGFWDMNVRDDRVRWWNDWCETMDFDPCEGPEHTKRWDARVHPEDFGNTNVFDDLLAGQINCSQAEYRLLTRRGTWHWIMSRARAVEFDGEGKPVRVVGVTVDIDQRKRMELALRDSEARLEAALSGSHLGVWDFDVARDQIQWLNDWCREVGIAEDRGPALVDEWNKHVHPDDLPRRLAVVMECRAGRQFSYEIEYRYRDRDGGYLWLVERGRIIARAMNGQASRVAGICMDITARKLQEASIARFRERYLAIVRNVPGFVFEIRPTLDGDSSIVWSSEGIKNVFGCDLTEYQRRGWRSFWHPEDYPRFAENLSSLRRGRATQQEWRIRTLDGRDKWIRTFYTPFKNPVTSLVDTIFGVALDFTDRVQLERQLVEAANLEQQRFARDLHDGLGQELTGISLSLSGIAANLRASMPREARELNHVIALVDKAIVNTRGLAHGLAPLNPAPGALQHALRVLARSTQKPQSLRISVSTQLDSIELSVEHATHLYRIAQEALANAIRHAQATRIEIRLEFSGGQGILSIADNGRGFVAAPEPQSGIGIRTMAHRARMIDGEFRVEPRRRGGTRIVCKFQHSPARPEP